MVNERMLAKAIGIASWEHTGQVDLKGDPYIFHPIRVMLAGITWEEKIVGVLHDVVEDTQITLGDLEAEGFGDPVIDALRALTHDDSTHTYEEYINGVILAGRLAITVKLNDMRDNLDPKRMYYLPMAEQQRLREKYGHQKTRLIAALEGVNENV